MATTHHGSLKESTQVGTLGYYFPLTIFILVRRFGTSGVADKGAPCLVTNTVVGLGRGTSTTSIARYTTVINTLVL